MGGNRTWMGCLLSLRLEPETLHLPTALEGRGGGGDRLYAQPAASRDPCPGNKHGHKEPTPRQSDLALSQAHVDRRPHGKPQQQLVGMRKRAALSWVPSM